MKKYHIPYKFLLSSFIILWMPGCAILASSTPQTATNTTAIPTAISTEIVAELPSHPSNLTSISGTKLPPTLDPKYVSNYLLGLYAIEGCELPCWWGITPGKTTWAEIQKDVSNYSIVYGPENWRGVESYAIEFSVAQDKFTEPTVTYRLWVRDGVVLAIGTNSGLITLDADNSLAGQLEKYGQPDEVWLSSIHFGGLQPRAYINLFYPSKGLWMFWISQAEEHDEKRLTICPNNRTREYKSINFFLFASDSQMTFEKSWDIATGRLDEKLGTYGPYGRLEKFTNDFNTERFYQTYLDRESIQCFDINLAE